MGYHRSGFDVVGVDIDPQPNCPFEFHQADAIEVLSILLSGGEWEGYTLADFAAIHASPPCQDHCSLRALHPSHGTGWMLLETISLLRSSGVPWVVENVPGSRREVPRGLPVFQLCGSSFGLAVRRHRLFWTSEQISSSKCDHRSQGQPLGVYGNGGGGQMTRGRKATPSEARVAMGIDWMAHSEISQAIPPAYTEFIGAQLIDQLERVA